MGLILDVYSLFDLFNTAAFYTLIKKFTEISHLWVELLLTKLDLFIYTIL